MFTGLIETTGRIARVQSTAGGRQLRIDTRLGAELVVGDSIAVNGVCLTVAVSDLEGFSADVSPETLRVTSLGTLPVSGIVNLERPLRADARLGGHFVLGHVDAVGRIANLRPDGDCFWLEVDVPAPLAPLMISKGSVAVDGISLTVAALRPAGIAVQIVPFTWSHTSLQEARAGDAVNLEADIIGKYVARLIEDRQPVENTR
jgi:riboflavin synthase